MPSGNQPHAGRLLKEGIGAMDWKHASRARAAWKRYDHYRRLERHGAPLPWHGRAAWRRVILTGLVLGFIVVLGLYHRWESYQREAGAPQIIKPLTAR